MNKVNVRNFTFKLLQMPKSYCWGNKRKRERRFLSLSNFTAMIRSNRTKSGLYCLPIHIIWRSVTIKTFLSTTKTGMGRHRVAHRETWWYTQHFWVPGNMGLCHVLARHWQGMVRAAQACAAGTGNPWFRTRKHRCQNHLIVTIHSNCSPFTFLSFFPA